ncbi:MAG TPA: translation elongation factor Ts [Bacteroidales bacterium]|nr:elongation factor Ts [Bacteroidales bacterium]HOX78639.1 translation elongation factor Ts [Bacteroidales bacterium]HPI87320.1 translation elongation factor Ts [Bacteroidales bacterium]HPM93590.1 translation elongation factor Ts [Bacteroidales bacterium]
MANITAAEVNKLRQITGAGMMDCKAALIESDGDTEKAIEVLRKKGQKVAAKRADKEATEGIVIAKTNDANDFGALVKVSCETDFVAKSDDFIHYVKGVIDLAIAKKPASTADLLALDLNGRTVEQNLTDLVGKIGEKMELAGYHTVGAPLVSAYNHLGNKLATLVGMNQKSPAVAEAAHNVAMQIAAMSPIAIDRDDVDKSVIEKEIEIGMDQARNEGKPENMLEKIAIGKLNKFYNENTLLNQEYVKDNTKNIRTYLQGIDKDLTVTAFVRQKLGD